MSSAQSRPSATPAAAPAVTPAGPPPPPDPSDPGGRRGGGPRLPVVVAALAVALIVAVGVAGLVLGRGTGADTAAAPSGSAAPTGPVLLVPVDAPQAGSADCAALLRALPATLVSGRSTLARLPLAAPVPTGAVAWASTGPEPIVLRCGIDQPPELQPTSELLEVSGVQWLRVAAGDDVTWYAVDRPVCVALTLPGNLGTGPIQDVSAAISASLPAAPVHPAGG